MFNLTIVEKINCSAKISTGCKYTFDNTTCPVSYQWIGEPVSVCDGICCFRPSLNDSEFIFRCDCANKADVLLLNKTVQIYTIQCDKHKQTASAVTLLIIILIVIAIVIFVLILQKIIECFWAAYCKRQNIQTETTPLIELKTVN